MALASCDDAVLHVIKLICKLGDLNMNTLWRVVVVCQKKCKSCCRVSKEVQELINKYVIPCLYMENNVMNCSLD